MSPRGFADPKAAKLAREVGRLRGRRDEITGRIETSLTMLGSEVFSIAQGGIGPLVGGADEFAEGTLDAPGINDQVLDRITNPARPVWRANGESDGGLTDDDRRRLAKALDHTRSTARIVRVAGRPHALVEEPTRREVMFLGVDALGTTATTDAEALATLATRRDRRTRGVFVTRSSWLRAVTVGGPNAVGMLGCVYDPASKRLGADPDDPWMIALARPGATRDSFVEAIAVAIPSGWRDDLGAVARKAHEPHVRHRNALRNIENTAKGLPVGDPRREPMLRYVVPAGKAARIFSFPAETWCTLWRGIVRYVSDVCWHMVPEDEVESAARRGQDRAPGRWEPGDLPLLLPTAEPFDPKTQMPEGPYTQLAGEVPFPTPLPFRSVALMPDIPLRIGPVEACHFGIRLIEPSEPRGDSRFVDAIDALLQALWVREDGLAVAILSIKLPSGEKMTGPQILRLPTGIESVVDVGSLCTFAPWMMLALVGLIEECREFVIDAREAAPNPEARTRPGGPAHVPRPYYRIELTDAVRVRAERRALMRSGILDADGEPVRVAREYGYRWDVRGHERVYLRRGPMPLVDAERRDLMRRGYRVYFSWEGRLVPWEPAEATDDELDLERMLARGLPRPQPGEWLGVMHRWIEDHVAGPEGAPYVPAERHVVVNPDVGI